MEEICAYCFDEVDPIYPVLIGRTMYLLETKHLECAFTDIGPKDEAGPSFDDAVRAMEED